MPRHKGLALALPLLGLAAISMLGAVPVAHATTTTLDMTACTATLGGTWSSGTCTLTTTYTILSGDTLEVPAGTTLTISGAGSIVVDSGGSLTVDSGGTVNVANSSISSESIDNQGTFTNSGTVNVAGSAVALAGIFNEGFTFTNSGTITINSGGISNAETFTNSGTIDIKNAGLIRNDFSLVNHGTINVENSGANTFGGIFNHGSFSTISNYGDGIINIANLGSSSKGIYNFQGTITNLGTINVKNSVGSGIDNFGIITNSGTIDIFGKIDNFGEIDNSGTITIECGGLLVNERGSTYNGFLPVQVTCTTTTSSSTTSRTTSTSTTTSVPVSVPEFPLGVAFLFAILVPILVVLRKWATSPRNSPL
jgi:hypothetical protein